MATSFHDAERVDAPMAILAPMKDLRTVGRSGDGESIELLDLDGNSYALRVTDHLKSLINQPRLAAVVSEDEVREEVISIKEIQARLRAGESMESISERGGVSVEKVERFSAPILQERSYIISLAQKVSLRKGEPSLLEVVAERLVPRGVEMKMTSWNAFRNEDGSWHLTLLYPTRDGEGSASWTFDQVKRSIKSFDDGARWIFGEEPIQHRTDSTVRSLRAESEVSTPPRLISIRSNPIESSESSAEVKELFASDLLDEDKTPELEIEEIFDDQPAVDEIPSDARRDGVTRKISIPSWDDIMFGPGGKRPEGSN